ncbi:DUF2835 family protein [Kushneria aurantia]|uniref:DUF2835 family protein n=1 Tax=Kushneria aurantia TaxID=504092 RepID=A0ABV6G494_9GAMM
MRRIIQSDGVHGAFRVSFDSSGRFVPIEALRFPVADIVDLYSHRWEIELGYREIPK